VSHRPLRAEKNCLNCNAEVYGRYCHICGQENAEPKESFWHLVSHFFSDVTHFDGKFFSTVKYLLTKPGFLSLEYMKGRRVRYLNPIRMYVFTSAIFFLFFFSVVKPEDSVNVSKTKKVPLTYASILERLGKEKQDTEHDLADRDMSTHDKEFLSQRLIFINEDLQRLQKDTTHLEELNISKNRLSGLPTTYTSIKQYDSVQNTLPGSKKDNWFQKKMAHRRVEIKQKFGQNSRGFVTELMNKFFHSFPQLLFISLPLIALILQLLYARKKNFYYADNIIYLIHVYCAMFILLFFQLSFNRLQHLPYLQWLKYLSIGVVLSMFFYVYKSMRNFYAQPRGKTVLKFSLLVLMSSVLMSTLFFIYLVVSVFTV
jgi:hypothetical protein